ncbi:MAG TPA: hypothetical protein DDX16_04970, partial [Candidatus Omnitrophica bacterium]|nr:hypothetical protein [Candidatus Omnitrophota bacterium]
SLIILTSPACGPPARHSIDSLSIYEPQNRILFIGDTYIERAFLKTTQSAASKHILHLNHKPHADSLENVNTFSKRLIANPEISLILPGHGDKIRAVSSPVVSKFQLLKGKYIPQLMHCIPKIGWPLVALGAGISLWGGLKYPVILKEFLDVFIQGWAMIGGVYLSSISKARYLWRLLILGNAIALIAVIYHNVSDLAKASELLSSIGVRYLSVFLGVHLGLALFNKEWRKSHFYK